MILRRVMFSTILAGLIAVPAHAGPLLFTFEGVIPTLTTNTVVETSVNGVFTSVATPGVFSNVPVSGSMTFDSDVWSLAGPPIAPTFPLRQFAVVDPSNSPNTLGVETPELLRGTLEIGAGVGTVPFDRQSLGTVTPNALVTFPYAGTTQMGYIDGTDGLNLNPPFELGDLFLASVSNSFAWFDVTLTPGTPGQVWGQTNSSILSLQLLSQYDSTFQLHDLFPAGPPLAFSFFDPVPGDCSGILCQDGRASLGNFSSVSSIGTFTANGLQTVTTTYQGSLVVNQAELRSAPEPASLALIAMGAAALRLAQRRSR